MSSSSPDSGTLDSSSRPSGDPERGSQRLLLVHAHPDDETISTGATMAYYAAKGAHVTLVTCTLGEVGEIFVPSLAGLAASAADQLGGYRLVELERACAALGVSDHRFLGGAGRYRDSGMMGTADNEHPRAFWQADLDTAARHLLEVIGELRPQVVVTYDEFGGYGHPDHIQAHRVTMRAVELASEAGIAPQRVYFSAIPRSVLAAGMQQFGDSTDNPFAGVERVEDLPFGVPDELIAVRVDAAVFAEAKFEAVRAHATQIPTTSWLFTLAASFSAAPEGAPDGGAADGGAAGGGGAGFMGVEHYRLASGEPSGGAMVDDLFAGLSLD